MGVTAELEVDAVLLGFFQMVGLVVDVNREELLVGILQNLA